MAPDIPVFYIEDENGDIKSTDDVLEWTRWFSLADRHVEMTEAGGGKVSTVFIGLDYGTFGDGQPLLYETMVFGGVMDGYVRRYTSRRAAREGHEEVVRDVLSRPVGSYTFSRRWTME